MENTRVWLVPAILLMFGVTAHTQGTFQNLNFEAANVPSLPPGQSAIVSIADGFPGWSGYLGGIPPTQIRHNAVTLAAVSISILGPNYSDSLLGTRIISGRYSALLQAGFDGVGQVSASIAQVGMVPIESLSLQIQSYGSPFAVSFGGQNIPLIPIGGGTNYTLYGGDISGFAGQMGELRFTAFPVSPTASTIVGLDSIVFSPTAIPEPSTWALLALGSALFCYAARRRRK